jgi:sugar O-acyltransferase (sialic acid O-acetyltransferase NeuD family)
MKNDFSRLIIYGAGALGHEIAEYACDAYNWNFQDSHKILFIDDTPGLKSHNPAWDVLSTFLDYKPKIGDKFLIGIGEPKIRNYLYQILCEKNIELATLIHPTAYISKFSNIGPGTIVAPFCTIGAESNLSPNSILNTYVAIGHHVTLGESCVLSPKVLVAGKSNIGDFVFIGSSAVITPKINIGSWCKIAASSVVYRSCQENFLVTGNPSKAIKI